MAAVGRAISTHATPLLTNITGKLVLAVAATVVTTLKPVLNVAVTVPLELARMLTTRKDPGVATNVVVMVQVEDVVLTPLIST